MTDPETGLYWWNYQHWYRVRNDPACDVGQYLGELEVMASRLLLEAHDELKLHNGEYVHLMPWQKPKPKPEEQAAASSKSSGWHYNAQYCKPAKKKPEPEDWKPNIPPGQEEYVMRKPNGDWWCLLCRKCATDEHFTGHLHLGRVKEPEWYMTHNAQMDGDQVALNPTNGRNTVANQPPGVVVKKEQGGEFFDYCSLCDAYIDDGHLNGKKHKTRLQYFNQGYRY
jgi:hypothetical protein